MNIEELVNHNKNLSDENMRLLEKLKKEALEKSLLLEISKTISSTLNVQEVLDRIVDSLKKVIPYDAAGIFLLDPKTNKLRPAVLRGYDYNAIKRAHLKVGRGLVGAVAKLEKGKIFPDVSKEPLYIGARKKTKSQISVPLTVKGRLLGVLNLESDRINAFDEEDLDLLTAFASHAAIAIENARLHEEVLRNRELERDLYIARKIQKALLPKKLPKVDGYDFATLNIPSKTVSGDFYDLAYIPSGKLVIAIGDVSGKGAPAAIIMASLYSAFKSLINEPISLNEKMSRLNELLTESLMIGTYSTFFVSELETRSRRFVYCNAGHLPPILVRKDGTIHKLFEGGTVLGFVKNAPYNQHEIILEEGDIILFYTDGLTEAQNKDGDFLEIDPIIELVKSNRNAAAEEIKEKIFKKVQRFTGKRHFEDDLTLIVMKVLRQSSLRNKNPR